MKKKGAAWGGVVIAVVAAWILFVRQSGERDVITPVRGTSAKVNVPAADVPQERSVEERVDEPLPVAMLDRALDAAGTWWYRAETGLGQSSIASSARQEQ